MRYVSAIAYGALLAGIWYAIFYLTGDTDTNWIIVGMAAAFGYWNGHKHGEEDALDFAYDHINSIPKEDDK